MSHTTELRDGWIAIHNGDYSGAVEFRKTGRDPADAPRRSQIVPFAVLADLVAEAVRDRRMEDLERMTTGGLLGLIVDEAGEGNTAPPLCYRCGHDDAGCTCDADAGDDL